jgi:hypothetical protein
MVRSAYAALQDRDRPPFTDQHTMDVALARERILQQMPGG